MKNYEQHVSDERLKKLIEVTDVKGWQSKRFYREMLLIMLELKHRRTEDPEWQEKKL